MQALQPVPHHFFETVPLTDERRAILDAVESAETPVGPKEIAEATGLPAASVRNMMPEMARAGQIRKVHRGTYQAAMRPGYRSLDEANAADGIHPHSGAPPEAPTTTAPSAHVILFTLAGGAVGFDINSRSFVQLAPAPDLGFEPDLSALSSAV